MKRFLKLLLAVAVASTSFASFAEDEPGGFFIVLEDAPKKPEPKKKKVVSFLEEPDQQIIGKATETFGQELQGAINSGIMNAAIDATFDFAMSIVTDSQGTASAQSDLAAAQEALEAAEAKFDKSLEDAAGAGDSAIALAKEVLAATPQLPDVIPAPANPLELQFATADPGFLAKAEPIAKKLQSAIIDHRYDPELKEIGIGALNSASVSWSNGSVVESEMQIEIARTAADFLVGIDPVSGSLRAVYELYTGKNLISGEDLTGFEQAFSGATLIVTLMSFGAGAPIMKALKASANVFGRVGFKGVQKGVSSLFRGAKYASGWLAKGATPARIVKLLHFQKTILGHGFRPDDIEYFYEAWRTNKEIGKNFQKTFEEIIAGRNLAEEAFRSGAYSTEQYTQRLKLAAAYYHGTANFTGKAEDIVSHMKGIDFGKEVELVNVDVNDVLKRYDHFGSSGGNYYTDGTVSIPSPTTVGVSAYSGNGMYNPLKTVGTYKALKPFKALKSTAGPIMVPDTLGFNKFGDAIKMDVYLHGGAPQYFLDPANLVKID